MSTSITEMKILIQAKIFCGQIGGKFIDKLRAGNALADQLEAQWRNALAPLTDEGHALLFNPQIEIWELGTNHRMDTCIYDCDFDDNGRDNLQSRVDELLPPSRLVGQTLEIEN